MRRDNTTGDVIVTNRRYVAQQLCRELALSPDEAERHLVAAASTGDLIRLSYAEYWFGEPE